MKKFFVMLMAVAALSFVSCDKGNKGGNDSEDAQEEFKGQVFEGANFTMQYPESMKTTYTNDRCINAADTADNSIKMDATFSDYPCIPEKFEEYAQNLTSMETYSLYKFEEPTINDNIMTIKGVNGDQVMNQYVVYLDEKAGVAGKLEYPTAKAAEIEKMLIPMLKSIKLKK